jgi:D-tyrosyl-tRNA(Tyr) deacylase
MKVVIQRVSKASVTINEVTVANIGHGLLVLLGIEHADADKPMQDIQWLCNKITNLRIFDDEQDVMNQSIKDINGEIIIVSQFTLHARTKKGNRPSYTDAAKPDISIPIYQQFIKHLQSLVTTPIQTGEFGANMQVSLLNDGPVTIIIDSKNKV